MLSLGQLCLCFSFIGELNSRPEFVSGLLNYTLLKNKYAVNQTFLLAERHPCDNIIQTL